MQKWYKGQKGQKLIWLIQNLWGWISTHEFFNSINFPNKIMFGQAFHTQIDEHEHEQVGDKSGVDENSASQQNENYPMSWIIKVCSDLIVAKEDIDCNHSNAQEHWDDFHRQAIGKVSHDESKKNWFSVNFPFLFFFFFFFAQLTLRN